MRTIQPEGQRGSRKWIQRAVNERWTVLERPILRAVRGGPVRWASPLATDEFAQYSGADFLERIGHGDLGGALNAFWPTSGPSWDALGVTPDGAVILIDAKSSLAEMCWAGPIPARQSRARSELVLQGVARRLGSRSGREAWCAQFYRLATQIAHLEFLRSNGVPAWLVLVDFVGDQDLRGPRSAEAWRAAYSIAFNLLDLRHAHPLRRFILHVNPDVSDVPPPFAGQLQFV
jgi:hypothetical protein